MPLLLIGCGSEVSKKDYNKKSEKIISKVSYGKIRPDSEISIQFYENQISAKDVGKYADSSAFIFAPKLSGKALWRDEKTIQFIPSHELDKRVRYSGVLNLNKLFGFEVEPKNVGVNFEASGNEVEDFNGFIQPVSELIPDDRYIFKGSITFSQAQRIEDVLKSVSFSSGFFSKKKLYITKVSDTQFTFKSEQLKRDANGKDFKFKIKAKRMYLENDFIKKFRLSPKGKLEFQGIEEDGDSEKARINLVFYEKMPKSLEYKDYIKIEPKIDFSTSVIDNRVILNANFQRGMKYSITIFGGLKSLYGSIMEKELKENYEITIGDIKPIVKFSNDGIYMTSGKNKKFCIRSINVERVQLEVIKVYEEDIVGFAQENGLIGSPSEDSLKRVGNLVVSNSVYIGKTKNRWVQTELDLSKLINKWNYGLYVVKLKFEKNDVLFYPSNWEDYELEDYLYSNGEVTRNLIFSDLGVTLKKDSKETHVFVNNIVTTEPVSNAVIISKLANGTIIDGANTNSNGMCTMEKLGDFVEVKYENQYSVLKVSESELAYTSFDVGGTDSEKGLKCYIYSDRGVYRPGEKIFLNAIIRNNNGSFPENHPVNLKLYNPKGNIVYDINSKLGKDGFYGFEVQTVPTDFTGNWNAEINVAGAKFVKQIKIEEIVPYTLKVNIKSPVQYITKSNSNLNFDVESKYLFGMPSRGLKNITDITLTPYNKEFEKYKDYLFTNSAQEFAEIQSGKFEETLDENGEAKYNWEIPQYGTVPSALDVNIKTKVIEKSGRPVPWILKIPVKIYSKYAGIKKLDENEYSNGANIKFNVVSVDENGNASSGDVLEYRIYKTENYWWWEYDNEDSFRKNFKSDKTLQLIASGSLVSTTSPQLINYTVSDYGEMLIEVENKSSGHITSQFFGAHWWGGSNGGGKGPEITTIKCDKKSYIVGDTAKISVKTPKNGKALVTIEKSGVIISKKWQNINSTTTEFKLPITEDMSPNVYFSVSLYQKFADSNNDMPIRVYATIPIIVDKKDTNLAFDVATPAEIRPNSNFNVDISTKDGKEAQFSVAIVDEGLLSLTNFITPDPKQQFYSKERMMTRTFDIYSNIIGLSWGAINKTVSIGGDGYNLNKQVVSKAKRFDPVVLYAGPFTTDKNGKKHLSFKMPNYVGAVRVMVVGVRGASFGAAEKQITVKSPLMVMPSLPRVLGTNDIIEMPVTIFAMNPSIKIVSIVVKCSGAVALDGSGGSQVTFNEPGEKDAYFRIKALNSIGVGKISVTAVSSNGETATKTTEIIVRPYNPSITKSESKFIPAGGTTTYTVPKEGIAGAAKFKVEITNQKKINFGTNIKYLITYPYGCIEQTTSAVLPQLYLKSVFNLSEAEKNEIDKNINAGILRLRKFQTVSGGFAYWPGESEPNLWGTNYAGHFLIEAKSKGYFVPEDMLKNWIKFEQNQSNKISENFTDMCYRLYLLSLVNSPDMSSMNLLKENFMLKLTNTDRYLLAAAYKQCGYDNAYNAIMSATKMDVKHYSELSGNFGSYLRDKAIMLEVAVRTKKFSNGSVLFDEISSNLTMDYWYSTQELGYSLLAVGKYIEATSANSKNSINASITGGGKNYKVTSKQMITVPINNCFGKNIIIKNTGVTPIFANLIWEGIPLENNIGNTSKGVALSVQWLNEDGEVFSPYTLNQGESFWGHFRVNKNYSLKLDKMALVQILPSGWEIDNTRLSGENMPVWATQLNIGHEEYLDIRDDRIMWFFDFKQGDEYYDFLVKLNAVTAGEFELPACLTETMYSDKFKATVAGQRVRVIRK